MNLSKILLNVVCQALIIFHRYRNTITGLAQIEKPPEFAGGILADHMGLGKTLSMLALIAANPANHMAKPDRAFDPSKCFKAKSTVIVVPFSCELHRNNHIKLDASLNP